MASTHDLIHRSGFVFEGTVEQLGASTSSTYPATEEAAVIRVSRLIKSTPALSGYQGRSVTVVLETPGRVKVGQLATFFTHGIHYGDGLVLTEVGAVDQLGALPDTDVSAALQSSADAALTDRLAQSDLVVTGTASAIRRHTPAQTLAGGLPASRVSEHDPDWWVATITVDSVEKGVYAGKTKNVLFANSTDVAWARAPKAKEGDRGIWLLHLKDVYGRPVPDHAMTHPLDFRPADEVGRIRALVM